MSDQPENEDRVDGVEGTQPTDAGASPSETPKKKRFAWFRGRSLKFWFRTLLLLVLAYVVLVPFARPLLVMAWSVMPLIVLPLVGIPFGIYLLRRNWRKCGTAMVILTILATGAVTAGNFTGWFVESQIASFIHPQAITKMPTTINNRIIARPTALHYAENSNSDNRLRIGRPHILTDLKTDTMYWQVPLHYTVWYGEIFGSTGGIVRVNAADTGQDAKTMDNSGFLFDDESWVAIAMFGWFYPLSDPA